MSAEPGMTLVPLGEPRGRALWSIRHYGRSYLVLDVDGELRVTDARCPHKGGPLAEGLVSDDVVTCPWHWYSFDLRTGECLTAEGYRLRYYPVVTKDGRQFAEVPAVSRPRGWSRLLSRARTRSARPGRSR